MPAHRPPSSRRRAALSLLLLAPFPSLGVWAALFAWPGPFGQALYLAAKAWILLFPWLWTRAVERAPFAPWRRRTGGVGFGVASGLVVALAIVAYYALWGADQLAGEALPETAARLGLATPRAFVLAALGYTFVNAWLEEYTWRWFATPRCVSLAGRAGGIALSALLFTAHHIVALLAYLDPGPTLLASGGVFTGGALWAWLRLRGDDLWAPYASHVLADAAIFAVGYHALFGWP
jgi:membrane protease YdiL (CAAX protease family)